MKRRILAILLTLITISVVFSQQLIPIQDKNGNKLLLQMNQQIGSAHRVYGQLPNIVAHTKSGVRVELGVGFSLISDFNTFLPYWKNGWGVGGSISYAVSQDIQLLASLSYSRFEYSGQGPFLAVPRDLVLSSTGDASHIYEASVGVRSLRSGYFIKPFISIRGGIQLTQVGEIHAIIWSDWGPPIVYRSSGKTFSKAFASVGLGVDVPVSSRFNILLEGMFSLTFDLSQQYCPIFATLQFEL